MIKRGTQTISKIYRGAREIAKIYRGRNLVWENGEQPQPVTGDFLTFSSPSRFTLATANSAKNWDGTLEYSQDAQNWYVWNGTTTLLAAASGGTYYLYLRGSGNTVITGSPNNEKRWIITGTNVKCNGSIECLLDYWTVVNGNHISLAGWAFAYLFSGNPALVKAPELTAITFVGQAVYYAMFSGCTGLTEITALPAQELTHICYGIMYRNCTGIKLSETQTDEYQTAFRIPSTGTGTEADTTSLAQMFQGTGGTFTGTPQINTTYYTSNAVIPAT